jgi:hypothetical protein
MIAEYRDDDQSDGLSVFENKISQLGGGSP